MQEQFADHTAYKQLPREVIKPGSFRHSSITLLGTVFFVFLVNWLLIIYFQNDTQNRGDYIVREKWHMVSTMSQPVNWLILGDSSANQGINPVIISEELDGNAVNLAMNASWTLLGDAWMLQSYLERFGAPDGIIIGHVYDVYHRAFNVNILAQSPVGLDTWSRLVPRLDLSADDLFEIFIIRYAPLYYRNATLQYLSQQLIQSPGTLFNGQEFLINADGYMPVARARRNRVVNDAKDHLRWLERTDNQFHVSEINNQALNEIIRLADQHQVHVYFVNSPIYDELFADESYQEYYSQFQDWMVTTTSGSPYVHYIEQAFIFTAGEMETVDHTVDASSIVYTHKIADEIKQIAALAGNLSD